MTDNRLESTNPEFCTTIADRVEKLLKCKLIARTTDEVSSSIKLWIPTGVPPLDWAIGGGIPCGRLVEFFGKEHQGKTLLFISTAVQCQKLGGIVVVFDKEYTFPLDFAIQCGLDLSRFIYITDYYDKKGILHIHTVESIVYIMEALVDKMLEADPNVIMLLGWDSIAATPTQAELEIDLSKENVQPGIAARSIGLLLRRLVGKIASTNIAFFFINQIRATFARFGRQTEAPGGAAVKCHASIRAEVLGAKGIWVDSEGYIGLESCVNIVKNKVGQPFRKAYFTIYWDRGVDAGSSLVYHLINTKQIKFTGGWFPFKGKNYHKEDLAKLLNEDSGAMDELKGWMK